MAASSVVLLLLLLLHCHCPLLGRVATMRCISFIVATTIVNRSRLLWSGLVYVGAYVGSRLAYVG
eukprot:scaffold293702_cov51-Attheya_sp.AAC.1